MRPLDTEVRDFNELRARCQGSKVTDFARRGKAGPTDSLPTPRRGRGIAARGAPLKLHSRRPRLTPDARARAEFEELLEPLLDSLLGYTLRLTGGKRPDAEDVLQESVYLAYRGFAGFQQGSNFKAWMFRIATNAFISSRRSAARAPLLCEELEAVAEPSVALSDELYDADTDWRAVFGDALQDEVRGALDELPEEFRVPLLLSCLGDMRYKEIAATIGVPVGTVMSRLFRARQRLRRSLRDFAAARGLDGASL